MTGLLAVLTSQGYLKAYRAGSPRSPHRVSNGCLLSEQVTELKSYIQAVADAELDGNDDMVAITASHAAKYAVQLVRQACDMSCMHSKVRCILWHRLCLC
jgi:hypothetical protein